jgi:uncharacterized protein (TIGR03083 family)
MHASADQIAGGGNAAAATLSAPRRSTLDRDTARRQMATEYQRVVDQLRSLSNQDWQAPTCNAGWDVLALSKHMLGMTAMAASVREQVRQMRTAKKRGGEFIDALTALQVETYNGWSGGQVVAEIERLAPKAVKGRGRTPRLLRGRAMPDPQPIDPPRLYEQWTFGYLIDVILTRDPWMHRTDIAAATGCELVLSPDHDGAIVADVAREWAERHGRPCVLTLTGPAGGTYEFGSAGQTLAYDAVEFCRILSGRGDGDGLLRTRVPF